MSTSFKAGMSIVVALIAGCGGGGGTQSSTPAAPVVAPPAPAPAAPIAVLSSSYQNFKNIGLSQQSLPASVRNTLARGYADFAQRGVVDLFTATQTYSPTTSTPATATPSEFAFWRKQADGSYVKDTALLSENTGCIHPRKAVIADFNNDGRPDVFVACHGYDALPFPGERSKIVLSQPNGTYAIKDASPDVGFFHGATAADLNGDGWVDLIVVNNFDAASAIVMLNKGDGTFVREQAPRLPAAIRNKPYFSVELVDINEDGKLDLLLGGHEFDGAATVALINPGNNDFSSVTPVILPAVANEGVALDFTLTGTGASRAIWVLRTSGGDGTFYQSRVVQKIMWPTLASTVPLNKRPAQWVAWLIPTTVGGQNAVASDDAAAGLSITY
ncbi:MAG: hypothetical protein JWQ01_3680 [Massilia sp.]|nr:hypothetical protein [Massilia sp.]